MPDKMLIDATHPEETRVVVLRGNRVEEFDFESANRKQLRGNIYLAKVTRVEPSLQAAFVDYGGNRHGFLAFAEIHPDYYQIPVADRQALLAQEEQDARQAEAEHENRASRGGRRNRHRRSDRSRDASRSEAVAETSNETTGEVSSEAIAEAALGGISPTENDRTEFPLSDAPASADVDTSAEAPADMQPLPTSEELDLPPLRQSHIETPAAVETADEQPVAVQPEGGDDHAETADEALLPDAQSIVADHNGDEQNGDDEHDDNGQSDGNGDDHHDDEPEQVESVGGADALEEVEDRKPRFRRNYKIQEVIKRRQVMLVQVVKEERGSKGAALTTYLSLAGRYSVLMPNTARGGGISRKITSGEDRSRLKEIAQELEVPEGMGVILRTAGAARTKMEVKRDFEYLLRLWETVRDLTLKSMAPTLVYEEGSLIKRSIRDLYSKDIDEIIVAGEAGYKEARDFMRMLMPTHAKNVKLYSDAQPLFTRYGIESQLDAMFQPTVQLKSGGYIVINQTEALVAIDVNSGRATREHHIEDTALKTNCEAADEVARQLRLRDLAGLIVIDFIDMDEGRNNRTVERRMKEALKHDRARIQVGRISHFGLLEMSRQRIRTSVLESSTEKCPVCGGLGHVRSVSSVALQLLRAIEDTLNKGGTHNLTVRTRSDVALYVLNHKRAHLRALEERFRITITVSADPNVAPQVSYMVERGEQIHSIEQAKAIAAAAPPLTIAIEEDDFVAPEEPEYEDEIIAASEDEDDAAEDETEAEGTEDGEAERDGSRRRRKRRGRGRGRGRGGPRDDQQPPQQQNLGEHTVAHEDHDAGSPEEDLSAPEQEGEEAATEGSEANGDPRRRRRRGRRGGRRNRQRGDEGVQGNGREAGEQNGAFAERGVHETSEGAPHPVLSDEDAGLMAPPFPQPTPVHQAAPAPSPTTPAASEPTSEAAPRRRSTIREPAPVGTSESTATAAPVPPAPAPTPILSSPAAAEPPKRGWWAKRLLGDKS
ncbi:Rne/Rng family ribonuclease [Undibacter mobilis]|uniref:Ribonuclease E n=1 Tax=Undibacter mobilis TaxID=2292256 RepID=A0A371BDG3_9BRAD|nr:Rne/Rng family ribonuclease [Undibacter mobilis]RDV05557.1 ribonuclease E/G [Undibacter mobilis]